MPGQQNAVLYCRYSSHGQNEQSIEGQLRDNYAFAEREGYRVVGEYIDRAISGRTDERPEFQRMIEDAAKKQFQFIIVWKLDRFARNRFDSAMYKAQLKKYGVRVISATENISDDPEGIILEGMLESLAEYYSANLSKHVKRGMRETALKGHFVGGGIPLGYKVVDKRLVADERTADIVRYAFRQYADGVPKTQIIEALNAKGIRNAAGRPLTQSFLSNIMRNEKYIGRYTVAGQEVAGGCEALLDEETFFKVQARLDTVKHAPAAGKAKVEYLLSGKAYCGMCGTRLVGESGRGRSGDTFYYYACGKRKKEHTCKKMNEKKDFLEWYVTEQTALYVLDPARMNFIAERVVAEWEKEFNDTAVRSLEQKITRLESEIQAAVDASIEAPAKMRQRFYDKMELLDIQKTELEADLTRLRIANGIRYTKEQVIAWMKIFCNGDPLDPQFQRRIFDVFVNSVYVYDNKIVVYYNVRGGKQVSYIEMLDSSEEPGAEEGPGDSAKAVRISDRVVSHSPKPYASRLWGFSIGCGRGQARLGHEGFPVERQAPQLPGKVFF